MTVKQKRNFLARLQAKRDRNWRAIEEAQERVQEIASQGAECPQDAAFVQALAKLIAMELFYRQAVRLRIDRGELDQVMDD